MIETILNLLGLAFTANLLGLAFIAGGAFIAALSVIISDEQAKRLSEPPYDGNAVYASLRRQIRKAGMVFYAWPSGSRCKQQG